MILFRVLSDEEAQQVKRWSAPNLNDKQSSSRSTVSAELLPALEIEPDGSLSPLHNQISEGVSAQGNAGDSEDTLTANTDNESGSTERVASVAFPSPSADMLQGAYEEGFNAGRVASDNQEYSQATNAILSLLTSMTNQRKQFDDSVEQELIMLATAMARLILHRELQLDPTMIRGIIRDALEQLPIAAEAPLIHLNPQDAELVRGLMTDTDSGIVVEDSNLSRGSCQIHAGMTLMEAGIDQMVSAISSRRVDGDSTASQKVDGGDSELTNDGSSETI